MEFCGLCNTHSSTNKPAGRQLLERLSNIFESCQVGPGMMCRRWFIPQMKSGPIILQYVHLNTFEYQKGLDLLEIVLPMKMYAEGMYYTQLSQYYIDCSTIVTCVRISTTWHYDFLQFQFHKF